VKFFIDECLSAELAKIAVARGHPESSCVKWRGLAGTQDWNLVPLMVAEDFTLVTRNSIDFRGRLGLGGGQGLYADLDLHAGLICLNGPVGMDLDMQIELFEVALEELEGREGDLVNRCLDVTLDETDHIEIVVYALPQS